MKSARLLLWPTSLSGSSVDPYNATTLDILSLCHNSKPKLFDAIVSFGTLAALAYRESSHESKVWNVWNVCTVGGLFP